MSSHSGYSNPAHTSGDIQLKSFTPLHSNEHVQNSDTPTSPEKPQQTFTNRTKPNGNGGSEVFGLGCSASGHVPLPGKEGGSVDATACDVREGDDDDDDDEDKRKKSHSAFEKQMEMEYSVTDLPPIHMCFLFGLQVSCVLRGHL